MMFVIMTKSLIRLGNTVRASLNTGLNDKVHDETRVKLMSKLMLMMMV